jgi:uncharacterized protein (DUF983 family)
MFRGLFRMNVRCPSCGVIFERDAGEITGGIAINTLLTATIAVAFAFSIFFIDFSMPVYIVLGGFTLVFPVVFYRHARALWTAILYLTGSMFED